MKIGTQQLLDRFKNSIELVAEAFVKGNIPRYLESYAEGIIGSKDITAAQARLDKRVWRPDARIVKLEHEVKELKEAVKELAYPDDTRL